MIGDHVFLIEQAFIGIVKYHFDGSYVAESIGTHFDDNRPRQIVFFESTPRIERTTWHDLRDKVIETILERVNLTLKINITNEQCKPMVLHLLWQWHIDLGKNNA